MALQWSIAAAVLLACSGASLSQPPTPGRRDSAQVGENQAAEEEREPKPKPAEAGRLPPPAPVDSPTAKPHADSPKNFAKESDCPAAIDYADGAIIFLTLGLLVVGILQWRTYARQADYMREGLDANKTAADAAMIGAKAAERAFADRNQPWLDSDNWRAEIVTIAGRLRIAGAFDIVNRGPTPAFTKWFGLRIRNDRLEEVGGSRGWRADNLIAPGGHITQRFEFPIGGENAATGKATRVEIQGIVGYSDYFSEDIPPGARFRRFGRYCEFLRPDGIIIFDPLPGSERIDKDPVDENWADKYGYVR